MLVKFEQNRMVQTIQNFELFNTKTIDFQTTIFQCFKTYGSLTRVIRFKVAPNMADPISIKDSDSSLKGLPVCSPSLCCLPVNCVFGVFQWHTWLRLIFSIKYFSTKQNKTKHKHRQTNKQTTKRFSTRQQLRLEWKWKKRWQKKWNAKKFYASFLRFLCYVLFVCLFLYNVLSETIKWC